MLGQRRRRWANIKPAEVHCAVHVGRGCLKTYNGILEGRGIILLKLKNGEYKLVHLRNPASNLDKINLFSRTTYFGTQ